MPISVYGTSVKKSTGSQFLRRLAPENIDAGQRQLRPAFFYIVVCTKKAGCFLAKLSD